MKITLNDIETFGLQSNLREQVLKLKPEHWQYAASLLSAMKEPTESAMNKAWSEMPRNQKPSLDDKKARIIPELIVRFIFSKHRNKS
jgi:hypothetical protein